MQTESFGIVEMLLRLGAGFLAGCVIGFERASRRQIAGLRTHALIALGSTLLMVLSIYMAESFLEEGDPGRIAAQVVSGIGFLGAGAIIRLGNNVKGLTTAASLWLVSGVGLAFGAGLWIPAAVATAVALFTLTALDSVEKRFFPPRRNKLLELRFKGEYPEHAKTLAVLKAFGIGVQSLDVAQHLGGKGAKGDSRMRLLVSIPTKTDMSRLSEALRKTGDVDRLEIKEKY
ncbi:MAG: MgtC/SapB family protein [Spirochaetales bacterium]|nr:MgtC/SapB family protein [Spirochaetales bacterium]